MRDAGPVATGTGSLPRGGPAGAGLLQGAEFHYFNLPHPDLWESALLRIRATGLNTVVVPVPWSYHSPGPDYSDLTGPRDLSRLFDMAKRAGLWLIVDIGPWLGIDLDAGGLPPWLLTSGAAGGALLRHVTDWWEQVLLHLDGRRNLVAVGVNFLGDPDGLLDAAAADCIAFALRRVFPVPLLLRETDRGSRAAREAGSSGGRLWLREAGPEGEPPLKVPGLSLRLIHAAQVADAGGAASGGLRRCASQALRDGARGFILRPGTEGVNWGWWGAAGAPVLAGEGAPVRPTALPAERFYAVRRVTLALETMARLLDPRSLPKGEPATPATGADAAQAATANPDETSGATGEALVVPPGAGGGLILGTAQGLPRLATRSPTSAGAWLVDGPVPRLLPLDWQLSGCRVQRTSMEPVLHTSVAGRELLILANEGGGEIALSRGLRLHHQRGPGRVTQTPQATLVQFGQAKLGSVVLNLPDRSVLQLLALEPPWVERVWPLDDRWRTSPAYPAYWTPSLEEPARGVIIGPDLVAPEPDGAFRILAGSKGFGYRWGPWQGSDPQTWLAPLTWIAPPSIETPDLAWESSPGSPEAAPTYDDGTWRLAHPRGDLTMEALGIDYGFVWYRGRFQAPASAVTLACRHACDVFLNGHHIASLSSPPDQAAFRPKNLPLPSRHLRPINVLALLVENRGRSAVGDREPHGLLSCALDTGSITEWRVRAGLAGERRRQGFPGFVDADLVAEAAAQVSALPGPATGSSAVTWHRSSFDLVLPHGVEVGLYLVLDRMPTRGYIYLNGHLVGRADYLQGHARRFWLPNGLLQRNAANELLVAQWTRGARPGIGDAHLDAEAVSVWRTVSVA